MMNDFNKSRNPEINALSSIIDKFFPTTEEENNALMLAARKKLADVFTVNMLKNMDQHFLSSEIMPLLLSAETISDYDVVGAYYTTSEECLPQLLIQVIAIQLCDGSEIHVINIQEEQNEAN